MITTITGSWGRPEVLDLHLQSLVNQTMPPEKMIIVDAGYSRRATHDQRKVVAKYDNVVYIQYYRIQRKKPRYRKTDACFYKGLRYVDTEFVTTFDVDCVFDPDYLERCITLISGYKNMIMSTPSIALPWVNEVKQGLSDGKSYRDMAIYEPDGQLKVLNFGQGYNFSSFKDFPNLCMSNNPFPSNWAYGFDGDCMYRTQHARDYELFDHNICGYGTSRSSVAQIALVYGLSIVVTKDILAYHISHDKFDGTYARRGIADTLKYLQRRAERIGGWPPSNPLIPVEQEGGLIK